MVSILPMRNISDIKIANVKAKYPFNHYRIPITVCKLYKGSHQKFAKVVRKFLFYPKGP